ncbi:hypothetical protein [Rhizobium lentis]|uniref:Transcriptional regulator n=1 Tax=Rhizobium lentis TaxID=1138194 RepID=A0ABS7ID14_9HYPH|nr:hypothetical protein [Rhizobium lentis]MBX5089351.1 hypothetical protein [Rhizobium lentis]
MAKKTVRKPAAKVNDELSRVVPKLISRGELLKAAEAVKEASPSEEQFDALMAENPGLREVYLSLQY